MKAAHLTLSISRRNAGMLDCVRRPAQELARAQGIAVEVFSLIDDRTEDDRGSWEPLPLHLFHASGPRNFAYSPAVAAALRESSVDLAHTFGLWTYLSHVTHAWATRTGKPYLVTPQGMLDPWAIAHSRQRKRLAGWLYENAHLRDAACLHATCQAELDGFRAFGLRNPVCIIPNGVDLPPATARDDVDPPWKTAVPPGRRVLLYLGRLHPKKGLPALLRAWAALRRREPVAKDWTLVLAGWDQDGHAAALAALVSELGVRDSVNFAGPLFGAEKAAAYRCADAFVLPSLSEGLPLVVLEAWSHRLPVVMTAACNLPEGFAAGAALESGPEPAALTEVLTKLVTAPEPERRQMGERGRALVERQFTWSNAADRFKQVYQWVTGQNGKPDFVSG